MSTVDFVLAKEKFSIYWVKYSIFNYKCTKTCVVRVLSGIFLGIYLTCCCKCLALSDMPALGLLASSSRRSASVLLSIPTTERKKEKSHCGRSGNTRMLFYLDYTICWYFHLVVQLVTFFSISSLFLWQRFPFKKVLYLFYYSEIQLYTIQNSSPAVFCNVNHCFCMYSIDTIQDCFIYLFFEF